MSESQDGVGSRPDRDACTRCGEPVTLAEIGGHEVALSAEPDPHGTVLLVPGVGMFLDGAALGQARKARLPLHTRHNVTCRDFWQRAKEL